MLVRLVSSSLRHGAQGLGARLAHAYESAVVAALALLARVTEVAEGLFALAGDANLTAGRHHAVVGGLDVTQVAVLLDARGEEALVVAIGAGLDAAHLRLVDLGAGEAGAVGAARHALVLARVVVGARGQGLLHGGAAGGQTVGAVVFAGGRAVRVVALVLVVGELVHGGQLDLLVVEVVGLLAGVASAAVHGDLALEVHGAAGLVGVEGVVLLVGVHGVHGFLLEIEALLAALLEHLHAHVDAVAGEGLGSNALVGVVVVAGVSLVGVDLVEALVEDLALVMKIATGGQAVGMLIHISDVQIERVRIGPVDRAAESSLVLLLALVVRQHLLAGWGETALAKGQEHLRGASLHGVYHGVSSSETGVNLRNIVVAVAGTSRSIA